MFFIITSVTYSDASIWWPIFSLCSKKLDKVRQQVLGSEGHRQLPPSSYKVLTRTGNSRRNPCQTPNKPPTLTLLWGDEMTRIIYFFFLIHTILCTQTGQQHSHPKAHSKSHEIWQHFHEYCLQHMNKYWVLSGSVFWLSLSKLLYPLEASSI